MRKLHLAADERVLLGKFQLRERKADQLPLRIFFVKYVVRKIANIYIYQSFARHSATGQSNQGIPLQSNDLDSLNVLGKSKSSKHIPQMVI